MGEAADWAIEQMENRALLETRPKSSGKSHGYYPRWAFDTEIWTTKDGEALKIEEMTPRHRGNVVRHLQRKFGAQVNSAPLVRRMLELGTE